MSLACKYMSVYFWTPFFFFCRSPFKKNLNSVCVLFLHAIFFLCESFRYPNLCLQNIFPCLFLLSVLMIVVHSLTHERERERENGVVSKACRAVWYINIYIFFYYFRPVAVLESILPVNILFFSFFPFFSRPDITVMVD